MSKKVKDNILFLRAFSGCDPTSAIFKQWKMKFAKFLDKDAGIQNTAEVFKNHHAAAPREVGIVGGKIFAALYGSSLQSSSLNEIRFTIFSKLLVQNNLNLATLSPIEDAAQLHSWRAFLQEARNEIFPICFSCRSASCTNVPDDIKNKPKLDDDVIISDDETVEELLDADSDNDFGQVQCLQLRSPKGAKVQ
ncbi:hypothetical protein AVEN_251982-1 [Araneus ventricosus]|uniref:Uncharacterized protein n=1 Tax=Araneus ventricosus TaxID=182803 RepID=A0A4Y2HMV5_ARAVE|nr:hypothetical protein AVEN_251982-1 [Araneus ventricosus]